MREPRLSKVMLFVGIILFLTSLLNICLALYLLQFKNNGLQGPSGVAGIQGSVGKQGPTGLNGLSVVGPQGIEGDPGLNAISSVTVIHDPIIGPQGEQGQAGQDGINGRETEMRSNPSNGDLEWRYVGDRFWNILLTHCQINNSCP